MVNKMFSRVYVTMTSPKQWWDSLTTTEKVLFVLGVIGGSLGIIAVVVLAVMLGTCRDKLRRAFPREMNYQMEHEFQLNSPYQ